MNDVMLEQLLKLKPASSVSLQLQLRKQIADAIIHGHFVPNAALPSSRKLAKQLHIARNTVVIAYEHLEDDGYLIAKERRGYFVNPEILKGRAAANANSDQDQVSENKPDWPSLIKYSYSQQPNISKPKNWQRYEYPFIYGQFDNSLFPTYKWRECCRDSVSDGDIRDWASDHFVQDDPLLIEEIRTRILPRRGIWADDDQIMITVGTQQGLYILSQLLLNETSTIAVEDPGYTDIRNIAAAHRTKVLSMPVDKDGLIISDQLSKCDCVFVTPSHQSPTTVTMPLSRRKQLLEMAANDNFLIIEDDYEAETNFSAKHTPALKSLDKDDRVLYTGSFSKIIAPGLRLGYLVGSKEIIREATALRRLMVRHPSANNQRSVALFISRGYYDALAAKLLQTYEARSQVMAQALAEEMPNSSVPSTFGGSSYWVQGLESLDARQLQMAARERSLILESGDIHFAAEQPPKNFFRLGYSSIRQNKIRAGIKLLAELIDEQIDSNKF